MGIMVRERAHESSLMEQRRADGSFCSAQLMPEPQLPSGWEKCLDLKSGLIYFKDWNSGTLTYRDPRRSAPVTTQRIGLLSISLSPESASTAMKSPSNAADDGVSKTFKRETNSSQKPVTQCRFSSSTVRLPWCFSTATQAESPVPETTNSMDEHSLELSLNLPGTSTSRPGTTSSQEGSVCTMEKVRSALERSQWLKSFPKKRASPSRESTSPGSRLHLESSSPTTSLSSSECFTSPSVMSYQGDDEEVQQPRECRDSDARSRVLFGKQENNINPVMVAVGCKRCLMYVMLSKSHPSCPKCGNTDVLLELPAPLPKRQRITLESPSWSWSTA